MLLNAEIKDDHYVDLPRQQEAQYAYPAARYLKADASTGQSYIDLNAAAQSYSGPWLMGKQTIEASAGDITIDWHQSCLVPAGIADGVMIRGNVIYQNPDGTYRMSQDQFEGVLRSGPNYRFFEGQTQHTYHAANVPFGAVHLTGRLHTPLTQTLPYNPMIAIAGGGQGGGQTAATYAPYARTPAVQPAGIFASQASPTGPAPGEHTTAGIFGSSDCQSQPQVSGEEQQLPDPGF